MAELPVLEDLLLFLARYHGRLEFFEADIPGTTEIVMELKDTGGASDPRLETEFSSDIRPELLAQMLLGLARGLATRLADQAM